LILIALVGVALGGERLRRRVVYCRQRASHSAAQASSLRRVIASYPRMAAGGEAVSQARAKAVSEYQALLGWYERAACAFEYASRHPWVPTPHDPDIYVEGLPESVYP
jgi:hypothetical protein